MTGAAVFAVVGLRNAKLAWAMPLAAGLVMVGTLSRGRCWLKQSRSWLR